MGRSAGPCGAVHRRSGRTVGSKTGTKTTNRPPPLRRKWPIHSSRTRTVDPLI